MKYRIGWERKGNWRYITVNSHPEMLAEVADKTLLSDKVSVRVIHSFELEADKRQTTDGRYGR